MAARSNFAITAKSEGLALPLTNPSVALEVLQAICALKGIDTSELEEIRQKKAKNVVGSKSG
jgi:hypothetical protein